MAFPTSSLTNNQVHKEGNRAFVYDSALGVWDQVRETDRTENKILQGEIGSGVTFPAGHVVQVVQHVIRDNFSTSSTSFVATPTTGAITPSSTSNKVYVSIVSVIDTGANERTPQMVLYRNGSALTNGSEGHMQAKSGAGGHIRVPFAINWLDSPSSTSAVTYTLYVKDTGAGGTIECPPYINMDHTLTLMEIKG